MRKFWQRIKPLEYLIRRRYKLKNSHNLSSLALNSNGIFSSSHLDNNNLSIRVIFIRLLDNLMDGNESNKPNSTAHCHTHLNLTYLAQAVRETLNYGL